MYPEFIGIYVLLIILIVLSVVSIYLQVSRSKNSGGKSNFNGNQQNNSFTPKQPHNSAYPSVNSQRQQTPAYGTSGVVFCKSCATQFDACHKVCPRCGTPR